MFFNRLPRLELMIFLAFFVSLSGLAEEKSVSTPALWPELLLQSGSTSSSVGTASIPLPHDIDPSFTQALHNGALRLNGKTVQGQTVAVWPGDEARPRRMILRWLNTEKPIEPTTGFSVGTSSAKDAGWSFSYDLVEGNKGEINWQMGTRNIPLEETEYEMYQLNLKHENKEFGIRLGLRTDKRIYWWQFIRADFIERGPVYDILRVGGPIYNGQYTLQSDLYLILYANGVTEAYPHFISHMREGESMDVNGIPVVAFDVKGKPKVDIPLDGEHPRFTLNDCTLDLDYTVHMADKQRQGSLKTEGDVVVLQPWLDQQVAGGLLVYREGVPEHHIIRKGGTTVEVGQKSKLGQADRFYVTTIGDKTFPKGLARSFRFYFALPGAEPSIARYQAPGWWHAIAGALPTIHNLPTSWWAVPHALKTAAGYATQDGESGPFEYGRGGNDGDGTLGASLLLLGQATNTMKHCEEALPACYWRADIPIHHTDFTISEIPYFGWQWIVQPYSRFMSAIPGYWETGDPYLLETAELAADGYYRFFTTNRPNRSVGRDTLPTEDMLLLYLTTGDRHYLTRIEHILEQARKSYEQTDCYWPGHQSGAGPNGVARRENYMYIPTLLARLHIAMIEEAGEAITPEKRTEYMAFADRTVALLETKWAGGENDWWPFAAALLYSDLPALAEFYPDRTSKYEELLCKYGEKFNMPESHSGGRAYSWITGALRFDAWVWGATWENGSLLLRPHKRLLDDPRAPKKVKIQTPKGSAEFEYSDGKMTTIQPLDYPIKIELNEKDH